MFLYFAVQRKENGKKKKRLLFHHGRQGGSNSFHLLFLKNTTLNMHLSIPMKKQIKFSSVQLLSHVQLCDPMNHSTVTPIKSLREFKIVYQNYVLVSLSTLLNLKFSKPGNMTWLSFNTE